MAKISLPIGNDIFPQVREDKLYYIDKTGLIPERQIADPDSIAPVHVSVQVCHRQTCAGMRGAAGAFLCASLASCRRLHLSGGLTSATETS